MSQSDENETAVLTKLAAFSVKMYSDHRTDHLVKACDRFGQLTLQQFFPFLKNS